MNETRDLERRACAGDVAAFGTLVRRFDHDLRGVAWSVVRSSHGTDDVVQETYEKAFRSIDTFDSRSGLKTWMHSICYRTAIDYIRYESRRNHLDIDSVPEPRAAGSTATSGVGRVEFAAVMEQIEPEQRAMLMLTAGLGYSYDEAAEITGRRRGTVASKVRRARKKLTRWEAA